MKLKNFVFLSSVFFMVAVAGYAQETAEETFSPQRAFYEKNKDIGGDVVIKDLTFDGNETYAYAVFEVDAPRSGNYYLSAWIMGGQKYNGTYLTYDILVNGEESGINAETREGNWQAMEARKKRIGGKETIALQQGINIISFRGHAPVIPNIEFIRLSMVKEKARISDEAYKQSLADMQVENEKIFQEKETRAAINTPQNVVYDYSFVRNMTYPYTAYVRCYFPIPCSVKIYSKKSQGSIPHVLSLFSDSFNNPGNYSWAKASDGSDYAEINADIQYPGMYFVKIHSKTSGVTGNVDLYISQGGSSGTTYNNLPVTCSRVLVTNTVIAKDPYSTFMINATEEPFITIENDATAPTKIIGFNCCYNILDNFPVINAVYNSATTDIPKAVYVSTWNTGTTGTGDLYANLRRGGTGSNYRDYIYITHSSAGTVNYNCFSWAGGVVTHAYSGPYGAPDNPLTQYKTDDGFFGNYTTNSSGNEVTLLRYNGAVTYERMGLNLNSPSAAIDIWTSSGHASICNTANDGNEHGPWWESKLESGFRQFHQRQNSGRGGIIHHYKRAAVQRSAAIMSMDESLAEGYSVLENPQFTEEEVSMLESLKAKLTLSEKTIFNDKHTASRTLMKNALYNREAYNSDEAGKNSYADLVSYARSCGDRVWPLVIEKYMEDKEANFKFMCDVFFTNNTYNTRIAEAIRDYTLENQYNEEGAYIVRSDYSNGILFIKQLLKELAGENYGLRAPMEYTGLQEEIKYSNEDPFTASFSSKNNEVKIGFDLDISCNINLTVWDANAREVTGIIHNSLLSPGNYEFSWNTSGYPADVYFIKYELNGNLNVKKVVCQ
ncbi:MAG: hypothetical protein LUG18_15420 [Candidatus Azobacteroides sp.]|nr:hypothetical protein [Candidatus Azobacteroides sp.]